jgi:purine-cytosine permease-like protein
MHVPRRKVRVLGRELHLPQSKLVRVGLGVSLVGLGFLGFLPVLGFWMVPLGLIILSVDLPVVRRWRRRTEVWLVPHWRRLHTWWRGTPHPSWRRRD